MLVIIPIRGGSKRIPRKALQLLAGHPLMAYAIASVKGHRVVVATEDNEIAACATRYGAEVVRRDPKNAQDDSPDIAWLTELRVVWENEREIMIRRITSPFLGADNIGDAISTWRACVDFSSLRAIARTTAHPGKAWTRHPGGIILPVCPWSFQTAQPWHSSPTQTLPTVYQQTGGLEIAGIGTLRGGSLAGWAPYGFLLTGPAALDINTPDELDYARWLADTGRAQLPEVQ